MINKFSNYHIYAVIAYAIPIIGYINNPGSVGVFSVIQSIILLLVYIRMKKMHMLETIYVDKRLKWFVVIILLGVANFLCAGNNNWGSISLMLSSILGYFNIIYYFLIQDASSISHYLKSFLWVLIPTAVYSFLTWKGFLSFDVPHILAPLALFFLITPFFRAKRLRFLVIVVYAYSFLSDISVRSCLLTGMVCTLVLVTFLFTPSNLFSRLSRLMRTFFLATPVVLLCLGLWGGFNVFAEMENTDVKVVNIDSGRKSENRMLNTDSRTGVYLDVLYSIETPKDIIVGKGIVINLETSWIDTRHSVEPGILNIFLRYGLIGCIVFFIIIYHATKLGIYHSNNSLTQLVAIFLSYKFLYMFIEDANINISMYLAYAICINEKIRSMTDQQLRQIL